MLLRRLKPHHTGAESSARGAPQSAAAYLRRAIVEPPVATADEADLRLELGLALAAHIQPDAYDLLQEAVAAATPRQRGAMALKAARALGMRPVQMLWLVVLPQAARVALPALASNLVALLKDSSLAFAIGVVELTNVGNRVQAVTFQPVATLTATACIYLLLTTLIGWFSSGLEHRLERDDRSRPGAH